MPGVLCTNCKQMVGEGMFCSNCATPLPPGASPAKLSAVKAWVLAIIVFSFIGFLFFISGIPPGRAVPAATGITGLKFNQLHIGMSYQEVVRVLGHSGVLISSYGSAESLTVIYYWEGEGSPGSNMNVMFQNDKLISKAQFGLK